jgi:hypothetical protein
MNRFLPLAEQKLGSFIKDGATPCAEDTSIRFSELEAMSAIAEPTPSATDTHPSVRLLLHHRGTPKH